MNKDPEKFLSVQRVYISLRQFQITFSVFLPIQQDILLHIQLWIIPPADLHSNWLS